MSRNAENSTVFPIPVRLWIFFSVLRRLGGLELELQAVSDQGVELTLEVRLSGDATAFVNELSALPGVSSAVLVASGGEALA